MVGRGPGTDYVDGLLTVDSVVGAAGLFAIHGDNLTLRSLEHGLHPGDKAGSELSAIDAGKDPPIGIMRWRTVL